MDFPKVLGETNPTYIGDGVYATHDGYQILLRTCRCGIWELIAIDDETWENLVRFREHVTTDGRVVPSSTSG